MRGVWAALALAAACLACSDPSDAPVEASTRLSQRGLYSDLRARRPAAGAIEYAPDYPLWSDGAEKRRWLILPAGAKIDTADMSHWRFPIGARLVKEFSLRGVLLETRLIEKVADTGDFLTDYFTGTFVWTADQTDAVLTEDGVLDTNGTDHEVPKQKACKACHEGEPGAVLGFSAVQLSRSGTLAELARRSLLTVDPGRTFAIPGDPVRTAAIGLLHANCGHCHSATGTQGKLRLRFLPDEATRPPEQWEIYQSVVGQPLTSVWSHPARLSVRVAPGRPDDSAIVFRMEQRGTVSANDDQMPPIATKKIDAQGVAAVRAWIASLPVTSAPDAGADAGVPADAATDAPADAAIDTSEDSAASEDLAAGPDGGTGE